jgi:hypothetical protein
MCPNRRQIPRAPVSQGTQPSFMFYRWLTKAQIRADTAEYLYLMLQSKDIGKETDEVENLLLEIEWCGIFHIVRSFSFFNRKRRSTIDQAVAENTSQTLAGIMLGKEER